VLAVGVEQAKKRLGRRRGRKADFSTALLTQNVSSFGRNDDFPVGEEKQRRVKAGNGKNGQR
jgi:hypothetical protein